MGCCQSTSEVCTSSPGRPSPAAALGSFRRVGTVLPDLTKFRPLQFRDITPEDYELLSQLDDLLPKAATGPNSLVDSLPRLQACHCGATECKVCMEEFEPETQVVRLPCGHVFCPQCITTWLTKHKNACPLCCSPVVGESEDAVFICAASSGDAESDSDFSAEPCDEMLSNILRPKSSTIFANKLALRYMYLTGHGKLP